MNPTPESTLSLNTRLLRSMCELSSDGLFFTDSEMKVLESNHRACKIHGVAFDGFTGMSYYRFLSPEETTKFQRLTESLCGGKIWVAKLTGLTGSGQSIPVELTVRREDFGCLPLFCIAVRDLTELKELEEHLHREKANRREMYITLKNVMKSIDKEKKGQEKGILHKIETLLLPALEKIGKETSEDIRNSYLSIVREQLIGLTKGFSKELDGRFLRLTRTEMKICQFVQAGHASKEIAESMNLSYETVQAHRRNIRRKLGLRGRRVNLYTFLSSRTFLHHRRP